MLFNTLRGRLCFQLHRIDKETETETGEALLPEVTLLLYISETVRDNMKRRTTSDLFLYCWCQAGSSCSRKCWMDGRMDEQKDGWVGEGWMDG